MDAERFGAFIQERRKELGLTQAELAEQLQVTDKAISRWERGVGFPGIDLLEPLAQALDITLIELMQSQRDSKDMLSAQSVCSIVSDTLEIAQEEKIKQEKRAETEKMINSAKHIQFTFAMLMLIESARGKESWWMWPLMYVIVYYSCAYRIHFLQKQDSEEILSHKNKGKSLATSVMKNVAFVAVMFLASYVIYALDKLTLQTLLGLTLGGMVCLVLYGLFLEKQKRKEEEA